MTPKLDREDRKFVQSVNRGLAQGKQLQVIAEELDVSPQTITQRMARLGFRLDKRFVPFGATIAA